MDHLHTLTGGAQDLPTRQRTLWNTIEWSYNLLGEGEKLLFARLAVFHGGYSLDAIEAVCAENPHQYYYDGSDSNIPHAAKPDF